ALVSAEQGWEGKAVAARTLGEGVPVEAWYLAEHFLLAWHDWNGLRERALRYFGQTAGWFPAEWSGLEGRGRGLAARLLRQGRLGGLVKASWSAPPGAAWSVVGGGKPEERLSVVRAACHDLIATHRRCALLLENAAWPRSLDAARRSNEQLIDLGGGLPAEF